MERPVEAPEPTVPETYLVLLTRSPDRSDGARVSLLPHERSRSADELRRLFPTVADSLQNGQLSGPRWDIGGSRYEAAFPTYGDLRIAFPDLAEHIRMNGHEHIRDSTSDVQLVVGVSRA